MKRLLIIGAGGHGKVVAETAVACGYEISFLDDKLGEGVVGEVSDLERFVDQYDEFFVGIGDKKTRRDISGRFLKIGAEIAILVHPTAYVSLTAKLSKGAIVEPMALVNTNSVIGAGVIVSVGSVIDHDVVVGDYAHINAGSICKGGAIIASERKLEAGEMVMAIIEKPCPVYY